MPNPHIELETFPKEKPVLLVCGNNNILIPEIINEYRSSFRIAHVTENDEESETSENYYRVKPTSAYLIDNLEEEIQYAVIFLDSTKDKEHVYHLLNKIDKDKTHTLIIINIRKKNEFYDVIHDLKNRQNILFGFLGDVYGFPDDHFECDVAKIIQISLLKQSITLTGDDLSQIFPIFIKDALNSINYLLFGLKKHSHFFYLFYSHPQTKLSAIHLIKRIVPELSIEFGKDENSTSKAEHVDIDGELFAKFTVKPVFLDSHFIGFEKSIKIIQGSGIQSEYVSSPEKKITAKEKIKIKVPKLGLLISILAASFFLFTTTCAVAAGLGVYFLKNATTSFEKNDFKKVEKNVKLSNTFLSVAEPTLHVFSSFAVNVLRNNTLDQLLRLKKSSNLLIIASNTLSTIKNLQNGIGEQSLEKSISDISYLYFEGEKIKVETGQKIFDKFINEKQSRILSISQILPQLLGFDKDKTYLLLFQNNGELRPTGGFIGSIGEVTFSKGKVSNFKIEDVYTGDGQLKAHVEPHYIIRRYLQPHLYLRDSNFFLSFENSASTAALLYNLETNKKVDGVVGIDFEAVRQIIKTVGPIELSDYQKTLDENNTFEFLQNTIEQKFFPGSTQKKELLQALFNQIFLKIEKKQNQSYSLVQLLPDLLLKKHILFAFNTKSMQGLFSANSFSDNFLDLRLKNDSDIFDVFSVNEANIGVDKANAYLTRNVTYDVYLTDSEVKSKATLEVVNTEPLSQNYKAYVRFVAPFGSALSSITIDGKDQKITPAVTDYKIYENKKFVPPPGLEVDTTTEEGYQTFGFIINVPKGTKQNIEVSYKNGLKKNVKSLFSYSLFAIKQPGTPEYPFSLKLHYGPEFSPQEVDNASLEKDLIIINETLLGDREFRMKLIKRQ